MKRELHYFDIYPKTVPVGLETPVTIQSLGAHQVFQSGESYDIEIIPMNHPADELLGEAYPRRTIRAEGGRLRLSWLFTEEQEYTLRVIMNGQGSYLAMRVYALREDLYARRPLRGDLHAHSTVSDGGEAPPVAAAHYRRAGYDFLALTDHCEYSGSAEAQRFYADKPIDLLLVGGEEVHSPNNLIHIVNFGGNYSVNDLWRNDEQRYFAEVRALADTLDIPPETGCVNRFVYAACRWVYDHIRRAGGLAIFAHPFWTIDAYQVDIDMCRYQLSQKPFDAFELVGGLHPTENNLQVALWQDMRAAGFEIPIVGSSDSHGTVPEPYEGSSYGNMVDNPFGFNEFYTIVFAERNSRDAIVSAVRDGFSVAVDAYRGQTPRVHGSFRMVSYALFLLSEYFPLHDELCYEEGRAMKALAAGDDEQALRDLQRMQGRTGRLADKHFGGGRRKL